MKTALSETVIRGIEGLARRVRAEVNRARSSGPRNDFELARLRSEGVKIAELIEEYARALRMLKRAEAALRRASRVQRAA